MALAHGAARWPSPSIPELAIHSPGACFLDVLVGSDASAQGRSGAAASLAPGRAGERRPHYSRRYAAIRAAFPRRRHDIRGRAGIVRPGDMPVGMANAASLDLHQDLAGSGRVRRCLFFHRQRRAEGARAVALIDAGMGHSSIQCCMKTGRSAFTMT